MDPEAALSNAEQHADWIRAGSPHGSKARIREFLAAYKQWRRGGGFEPEDGDARAQSLAKFLRQPKGSTNMATATADSEAATELTLYIENDGDLHRQQGEPILRNLANKAAQGKYDHAKAVKLYMYLMESGAKKYAREFDQAENWHRMFSVPTRKEAAEAFVKSFETEYRLGNYDGLLSKVSAKKKAGGASNLANGGKVMRTFTFQHDTDLN